MEPQLELERFAKWLSKKQIKECVIIVSNGDIQSATSFRKGDILSVYYHEMNNDNEEQDFDEYQKP